MLKWTPKASDDLEFIMDHISENFDVNLAVKTISETLKIKKTKLLFLDSAREKKRAQC